MTSASTSSLKWLPNALTIARCGLAGLVAWWIIAEPATSWLPLLSFILVAATDFLDGWAARRFDAVSAFGAFLDPVADKLLVGLALLALALKQDWTWLVLIPAIAIISRDLVATGLRLMPGIVLPVSRLAKWKTALEMFGIGALLCAGPVGLAIIWPLGLGLVWIAALLSVYTLGLYIGSLLAD